MRPIVTTGLALLLCAASGCTKPSHEDCVSGGAPCEPGLSMCNRITRVCERLPDLPVEEVQQPLCDDETGWCWDRPWIMGGYAKGMVVLGNDDLFLVADSAVLRLQAGRWSVDKRLSLDDRPLGIAGTAADDLWVVGRRVYHRTTAGWTQVQTPAVGDLSSVWSIDKNDAWAVGGGNILRWDGGAWSVAKQAPGVSAIWAAAKDDVWAVGSPGIALHWDGKGWTAPSSGLKIATLRALWGQSGSDLWAVGSARYHYDGASWTEHAGEAANVWGDGRGKVWFVNRDNGGLKVATLATQTGVTQEITLNLSDSQAGSNVYALAGSSGEDVWMAGNQDVYHLVGANWERHSRGVSAAFSDVALLGREVFAVSGVGGVYLSHGVGGRWSEEPIAEMASTSFYNWVAVASSSDVWVAGRTVQGRGLLHRDKGSWSRVPGVTFAGPIRAFGPDDVWMYGGDAIAHWDGRAWSQRELARKAVDAVYNVWARSPTEVWAVGMQGQILRLDGDGWTAQASGTTQNLHGIWGVGDELFVVGNGGTILHKAAGQSVWRREFTKAPPSDHLFYAVWGFSRDDVWAGALGYYAVHYDGATWSNVEIAGTPDIAAMTGDDSEIWAVGLTGEILHRSRLTSAR